jgi:transcriptional regulator with XRE-family HTH domain
VSATTTAIRVGLARKNKPQSVLADVLDLSQPAIHRRMSGRVSWRLDELQAVADYLDVPLSALIASEDVA